MARKKKAIPARTRAATSKRASKSNPKPSRPLYTKCKASWYRLSTPEQRAAHIKYFRGAVDDVRKVFANFSGKDGYDIRRIEHWPRSRLSKLSQYAATLRKWEAGDGGNQFIIVKPKTKAERAALERHTGQVSISERKHPQKAYVVPTGMPSRARVRYVAEPARETVVSSKGRGTKRIEARERIPQRLRVEVVRKVKGGKIINRDYLFREALGWQPGLESARWMKKAAKAGLPTDPWGQMVAAIGEIADIAPAAIARGAYRGEEAQYRLLTSSGLIGPTVPHHQLRALLNRWAGVYKSSFASTIIGVRMMGSEYQARSPSNPDNLQAQSERRRAKYAALSKRQRRAALRKFASGHEPAKKKPTAKRSRKPKKKAIPRTKFAGTRKRMKR